MLRLQLKSVMRCRPSSSSIAAVICLSLIAGRVLRSSAFVPPIARGGNFVVERVNDDGLLLLTTGHSVRLLGVNLPDRQDRDGTHAQISQDALTLIRRRATGRRVTLELDRTRIDQQWSTLAYVHVGELLLNVKLIREGYGTVDRQFPLQSERRDQLEDAEEQARGAGVGIWSLP